LVFFLSSLFAAVAGILSAIDIGVTPHSGMGPILNAAVATMIAGRKNLYVAAFAGIMLGMVQSFTVMFWSAQWQQLSTFIILIAVLLVRRKGLFSFETRAEES
jgi:branched-chain amino acid transport system permease protein